MAVHVGGSEMEINLTPLLDLILQLIMFFLACANFAADQASSNVQLPLSTSAQEIQPKTEDEFIVINIELVRQDRRAPSGERILIDGKPVRDPIEPRTIRFRIVGGEDIVFNADNPEQKALGLGRAMNRMASLANTLRFRLAGRKKVPLAEIKTIDIPVIVRADAETEYVLIYQLIVQCKGSGFPRVELRATTKQE
jgi:biopolymer transport protein ExbD